MSDSAHPLTLWLARASMAFYAAAVLIMASHTVSRTKGFQLWRVLWSVACLLLIVHVLVAFHFDHGWSHMSAWRQTATQTARVTGLHWGGGLYFNYVFLAMWLADVIVLWRRPDSVHSRPHQFVVLAGFFMAVNATVVFGPRWWFWPVTATGLAAFLIYLRTSGSSQRTVSPRR